MPTAEQRFVSFPNKYGPYEDTLQKLKNKLNISEKEAEEQMKLYW